MSLQLESAGHEPHGLLIDENGRALTSALSFPGLVAATDRGDAFYLMSGFLSLTTVDVQHAGLFIKNTSQRDLRIHSIRTCGHGIQLWRLFRNPTTGTIVTDANQIDPINLDFGAGAAFQGQSFYGGEGKTVTDGAQGPQWINHAGHSIENFSGGLKLQANNSLALTVQPTEVGYSCISVLAFYDK